MKKLVGLCLVLALFSCHQAERFDVPGKPTHPISINRFDQTFYQTGSYQDSTFWELYANQIMEVGEPGTALYQQFDSIYHSDKQMKQIYNDCQAAFGDVKEIEQDLTWAFFRLHYFFPTIPYPKVFMHISGFGESIVSAPGMLSASIDNYLGVEYPLYETLFQPYQMQRMYPDKIVSDYVTGWIRSEFTESSMLDQHRLLDYLVYEGKLLYLLRVLLPDENMENLSGFTKSQLIWCAKNEKNMWDAIVNQQHLYSSDPLVLSKYLGESPMTAYFPKESPGRAAVWTGFRIVERYMENDPKASLQSLFKTKTEVILSKSLYRP